MWRPLLLACVVGALAALTQTGTSVCNDASRLATAQSLVEHGTFAIDQSYFAYTCDFATIDGRMVSDKPPVFSVILAGLYALVTGITGWEPAHDLFSLYYVLALLTSGLALVMIAEGARRIAARLECTPPMAALVGAAASLGTLALTYATTISNHVVAAACLVWGALSLLSDRTKDNPPDHPDGAGRALGAGALLGLATVVDPLAVVFAATLSALAWHQQGRQGLMVVVGALPFATAHMALTYSIGGHPIALNLDPQNFAYAGSIHNEQTLTGVGFKHERLSALATYAWHSLAGFRGFIPYNLPAALGVLGLASLAWRRRCAWAASVLVGLAGFFVLTIGFSANYSGNGYGIRWHALVSPLAAAGLVGLLPAQASRASERWRSMVVVASLGVGATMASLGTINPLSVWSGGQMHSAERVLGAPQQNVDYLLAQARPLHDHGRHAQAIYFAELALTYIEPVPDLWYILVHSSIALDDTDRLVAYREQIPRLDMPYADALVAAIDAHLEH